jgi:predicted HicB family RNase H-like nuclease
MPGDRRADAAEHAAHVNEAAGLLEAGVPAAEAARVLAGRLGCSERQARRYVSQAAASGRVPVPEEGTVFTVRLPARLAAAAREHARASGRTVSSVAAQALEEFLGRTHGTRPRR